MSLPDALVAALAIATLPAVVYAALAAMRLYERNRERRIRSYVILGGEVQVFEHRIEAPAEAAIGDEWGEREAGGWNVYRFTPQGWTLYRTVPPEASRHA